MFNYFRFHHMIITGDINSRCGDIIHSNPTIKHVSNPCQIVNMNRKKIINILQDQKDLVMANGFISNQVTFDSNYTFYRGKWKSQVDFLFTNNIDSISSFKILDKNIYSNHCPISSTFCATFNINLNFINECTKACFNYDCYDVNKRSPNCIKWQRVDIVKMTALMEQDAQQIMSDLHNAKDAAKVINYHMSYIQHAKIVTK